LPEVISFAQEGRDYRKKRYDILLYQQEDFQRKVGTFPSINFEYALGAIATHVGMPAKFSHLGHSVDQIRRIIAALREWYLIYEVPTRGVSSTTQFHPKRYLYDLGILQDVRAMPFPALSILKTKSSALRTQIGGLLENALLLNLESPDGLELGISAWREDPASSQEVDFIVREANRIVPIECKASLSVSARSFNSLKAYIDISGVACGILVSGAPFQVIKSRNTTLINVPFYLAVKPILSRLTERLIPVRP
jgi:predicted AAA+ superfamily ATPase